MLFSTWFLLSTVFSFLVFHLLWRRQQKIILPECIPMLSTLPLIGSVHHFFEGRDLVKLLRKWQMKLGTIFGVSLFGIPVVVISEPKYLQKILSSSEPGHLNRPSLQTTSVFPPNFRFGLLPGNGEAWKSQRFVVGKAFTHEALKTYLPTLNLHAKQLISEVKSVLAENKGEPITQLQDLLLLASMRIVIHVVTGKNVQGNENEESSQFLKDFHSIEATSAKFLVSPWFAVPPFSWWFSKERAEVGRKGANMEKFFQKILEQCKNGEDDSSFRSMMRVMLNQGVCDADLLSECFWLTFAGNNTVGLTSLYTLFILALHPEHQEKCREEVDEVFTEVKGKDGNLTYEDIYKLIYLERCIKESQRRITVVPGTVRKLETPLKLEENLELSIGTIVLSFHDQAHMHPKAFPNPEKYDPDRFLPENIHSRNSYAFTPFSAGRRDCIGGKMAMMEMKIILAFMLRHFEFETLDSYDNVEVYYNVSMTPKRFIRFRLKEREHLNL
ncbi:unnamed protein product [Orchesella dallaii]|uniref:Cytochrome P450 n=1 Tax=Orchesella dallaii TaxID=48710 RepID=A0ABP1QVI9_9HEXA